MSYWDPTPQEFTGSLWESVGRQLSVMIIIFSTTEKEPTYKARNRTSPGMFPSFWATFVYMVGNSTGMGQVGRVGRGLGDRSLQRSLWLFTNVTSLLSHWRS